MMPATPSLAQRIGVDAGAVLGVRERRPRPLRREERFAMALLEVHYKPYGDEADAVPGHAFGSAEETADVARAAERLLERQLPRKERKQVLIGTVRASSGSGYALTRTGVGAADRLRRSIGYTFRHDDG